MGSWVPATFATLSVSVLDLSTGDRTDLLLLEPVHNFGWVMVVYDVVNVNDRSSTWLVTGLQAIVGTVRHGPVLAPP